MRKASTIKIRTYNVSKHPAYHFRNNAERFWPCFEVTNSTVHGGYFQSRFMLFTSNYIHIIAVTA